MRKKFFGVLSSVLILSLFVCGSSFAVDIPPEFTPDPDLSAQALGMAKEQFVTLKKQLQAMIFSSPATQQAMVNQVIAVVDDKLERLEETRIVVYFTDEDTPGAAYDSLHAFYQDKLNDLRNVSNEDLLFAVMQTPPGMVPQPTMDSLAALIKQGKVRAATGASGKSRVSMLTVYVTQSFQVIEGTTLVIATDK
ncbi:MAG: hypothetical protein GY801_46880 [bacterium]|nr:hypothetical protein [bacterium]